MPLSLQHDSKTKKLLLSGEPITGEFCPAAGGEPAHCIVHWTDEGGAQVSLIEPPQGWEAKLGGPHFPVHGITTSGEEITLLDAWVNQMQLGDRISRLQSSTIAIGAHTVPEERWKRIAYSTANLSEWKPETGLMHSGPTRRKPRHQRIDFNAPAAEEVVLPRAAVRFEISADSLWAYAPDWSMRTWLDLGVRPNRSITLDQAHHDYAQPLLAFVHFASDRPDSLTRELLWEPDSGRSIEVMRMGKRIEPREWRPGPRNGYLFQRRDLPDLSHAIRRWWKLHQEVKPSLGLFAEHISTGSIFSPSRLLTLHASMEKYAKARFGAKREFQNLRAYGGVPNDLTGCTNDALKLLGASRGYFAHADVRGDGFTPEEIEGKTIETTRRASALMQSCLLKEVGFRKAERIDLMERHYGNWPIP